MPHTPDRVASPGVQALNKRGRSLPRTSGRQRSWPSPASLTSNGSGLISPSTALNPAKIAVHVISAKSNPCSASSSAASDPCCAKSVALASFAATLNRFLVSRRGSAAAIVVFQASCSRTSCSEWRDRTRMIVQNRPLSVILPVDALERSENPGAQSPSLGHCVYPSRCSPCSTQRPSVPSRPAPHRSNPQRDLTDDQRLRDAR